jgi:hypothetical protein
MSALAHLGGQMARKYVNPNRPSPTLVTDALLAEARTRADAAAARVRAAERADPARPGWDSEYAAATSAATATQRRVDALAALRAAQLERSGKRDAAVKAADLDAMAAALAASRDQVAAATADHLRSLAAVASAVDAHNKLLATGRARLAELGLAARDDLVDIEAGQEHPEGTIDRGVRAGGRDWTAIPAPGLVAHALLQVFGCFRGPFASMRHAWPPHQVESRPDGLNVPTLEAVGVTLPPVPVPVVARPAPLSDVLPAAAANGADVSGYRPGVRTVAG